MFIVIVMVIVMAKVIQLVIATAAVMAIGRNTNTSHSKGANQLWQNRSSYAHLV